MADSRANCRGQRGTTPARGFSVTVMVEGRSRSLPAGLTIAQILERLELPAMAGDLVGR
jgi:hypothetical protein